MKDKLDGYEPKDIANGDETGPVSFIHCQTKLFV
jgi:hypothetical protein